MRKLSFLLSCLVAGHAIAAPQIVIDGTVPYTLKMEHDQREKSIRLLKMNLSDRAKYQLKNTISTLLNQPNHASFAANAARQLPSHVQLGMNRVPVLDQGSHGTCVMFAVTAALDALLEQGDYISQLCPLMLGNHIANNATYRPSGWNGASASMTLARLSEYGIVSKDQERSEGCGGLNEYPLISLDPEGEMTLVDYHQLSENSEPFYEDEHFIQTEILNYQQRFLNKVSMVNIQEEVKTTLYQGDRVLLGVLLPMNEWIGLEGKHHQEHDTWILNGRTEYLAERALIDPSQWGHWGGHEMIITGYDDTAVAVDKEGRVHQGLFTLRNSWGTGVGDNGTFYMSYDYFRALTGDLVRIGNLNLS